MTVKQIVDRIAGKVEDDWTLQDCRVVERQGEIFGLQFHARQAITGEVREGEIPITAKRAMTILGYQAEANGDKLSWELTSIFAAVSDQIRHGGRVRSAV